VTNGADSDMGAVAGAGWEGGRWDNRHRGDSSWCSGYVRRRQSWALCTGEPRR
jgi:hypothetical protein